MMLEYVALDYLETGFPIGPFTSKEGRYPGKYPVFGVIVSGFIGVLLGVAEIDRSQKVRPDPSDKIKLYKPAIIIGRFVTFRTPPARCQD